MSDNIPLDIQMEIIKKVYDVKSLIRFRSVSKPWKSFINSSKFINGYGIRHTHPHSRILTYYVDHSSDVLRFIYWGARKVTFTDDGESTTNHIIVSFDLITKEFKVVDLPNTLTNEWTLRVSVSKLRGTLVVYGYIKVTRALCCGVWVMERDSSFRKLFTIRSSMDKILGFRKNGEPIYEIRKADGKDGPFTTLNVYDPYSQHIKNLGISGKDGSFFMGSYKESLLLLDHSDLHIYSGYR
ncbi:probable LRR receptor-like serine/threonine-protein kinase isoform X2 [Tanacetum coccineum]